MWVNTLQCPGQPLSPASNVTGAEVEKCWPRDVVASFRIIVFTFYLFIFREKGREGERERNIDVRETHPPVASPYAPQLGVRHVT